MSKYITTPLVNDPVALMDHLERWPIKDGYFECYTTLYWLHTITNAVGEIYDTAPAAWNPNTNKLRIKIYGKNPMTDTKTCTQCGEVFPATTEYFHRKGRGEALNLWCKTCANERSRRWRAKNKDKIREYRAKNKDKMRRWRAENREEIREYFRRWHAENKDKMREYNRRYYAKNKDKMRENTRRWRAKNKDRIREYNRRWRAANKGKSND